ncbi:hypothetical protein MY4038_009919 [Beauveria bassiana]
MEPPQPPTTFTGRTVSWYEILEWQQDNRFILNGYRRETADYRAIMTGLTFLHNETCNVYTHFLGALLLPIIAVIVMCVLHLQLRFSGVSGADYAIFAIFFCCAEVCLLFSAAFHLLSNPIPTANMRVCIVDVFKCLQKRL